MTTDDHLHSTSKLDILLESANLLGISDLSFPSYASTITRLSSQSFILSHTLNDLKLLEEELHNHLTGIEHTQQLLVAQIQSHDDANKAGSEEAQTLAARRDALFKQAKGYQRELELLMKEMPPNPPVTVTSLQQLRDANKSKKAELEEKRERLKAFKGLPPNIDLARLQLRKAREEHMELVKLRERLLGRMVDSVK